MIHVQWNPVKGFEVADKCSEISTEGREVWRIYLPANRYRRQGSMEDLFAGKEISKAGKCGRSTRWHRDTEGREVWRI